MVSDCLSMETEVKKAILPERALVTHNVLFVSGSIGLGHVTRDLAIAAELRRQRPDVR